MPIVPELEITGGMYGEVKILTHLDGQLGENVHYFRVASIESTSTMKNPQVFCNQLSTWFAAVIKPLICTPAKYLGVSLRMYDQDLPTVKWATLWSKTAAGVGEAGTTPCPKQVAGLMTKRTASAGRNARGRTFVPFPATDDVEPNGNPTASYLTRLSNYAARIDSTEGLGLVGAEACDIQFGLYRWRIFDTFRPTTDVVVRDVFATQMRRGDYGRVNAIPDELK